MERIEALETDDELDAYFNSEEGGVLYTPEQLLESNEQQMAGLRNQPGNLARRGGRAAARKAGESIGESMLGNILGGPIGGYLGGLAGEYLMPDEGLMPNNAGGVAFGQEEIEERMSRLERQNKLLREYIARRNQRQSS